MAKKILHSVKAKLKVKLKMKGYVNEVYIHGSYQWQGNIGD